MVYFDNVRKRPAFFFFSHIHTFLTNLRPVSFGNLVNVRKRLVSIFFFTCINFSQIRDRSLLSIVQLYQGNEQKKIAYMNEIFANPVLNIEMLVLEIYFKMFICDFYIKKGKILIFNI